MQNKSKQGTVETNRGNTYQMNEVINFIKAFPNEFAALHQEIHYALDGIDAFSLDETLLDAMANYFTEQEDYSGADARKTVLMLVRIKKVIDICQFYVANTPFSINDGPAIQQKKESA